MVAYTYWFNHTFVPLSNIPTALSTQSLFQFLGSVSLAFISLPTPYSMSPFRMNWTQLVLLIYSSVTSIAAFIVILAQTGALPPQPSRYDHSLSSPGQSRMEWCTFPIKHHMQPSTIFPITPFLRSNSNRNYNSPCYKQNEYPFIPITSTYYVWNGNPPPNLPGPHQLQ